MLKEIASRIAHTVERSAYRAFVGKEPTHPTFGVTEAIKAQRTVDQAVQNNPEHGGTSTAMIAGCYLAYGPERCNLKKLAHDPIVYRTEKYFRALNDLLSMKRRLAEVEGGTEALDYLQGEFNDKQNKINAYWQEPGLDSAEVARRSDLQKSFINAKSEVTFVEETINNHAALIEAGGGGGEPYTWKENYDMFALRRKLVNAIEIILTIQECTDVHMFSDRLSAQPEHISIKSLKNKYAWIIDETFDDTTLTADEKRARMLYFGTMSTQAVNNKKRFKHDRTYGNWKEITYMMQIMGLSEKDAGKILDDDARSYRMLAEKYGLSQLVTLGLDTAIDGALSIANQTKSDSLIPKRILEILVNARTEPGRQKAELMAHSKGLTIE